MASKSKSRRRVFRASCILAALIVAGSSFAWFSSKDEVTNRLSASANYGVSIVEDFQPPKNFLPGQKVNKDVAVVNTGNVDAFVRTWIDGEMSLVKKLDWANSTDADDSGATIENFSNDLLKTTDDQTKLTGVNLNWYKGTNYYKELSQIKSENPLNATTSEEEANEDTNQLARFSEVQSIQAGGVLVYHADDAEYYYVLEQATTVTGKKVTSETAASEETTEMYPAGTIVATEGSCTAANAGVIIANDYYGNIDTSLFYPETEGLYLFGRNVKETGAANAVDDYEYTGYYFFPDGDTNETTATAKADDIDDTDVRRGEGYNPVYLALCYDTSHTQRSDYVLPDTALITRTTDPTKDEVLPVTLSDVKLYTATEKVLKSYVEDGTVTYTVGGNEVTVSSEGTMPAGYTHKVVIGETTYCGTGDSGTFKRYNSADGQVVEEDTIQVVKTTGTKLNWTYTPYLAATSTTYKLDGNTTSGVPTADADNAPYTGYTWRIDDNGVTYWSTAKTGQSYYVESDINDTTGIAMGATPHTVTEVAGTAATGGVLAATYGTEGQDDYIKVNVQLANLDNAPDTSGNAETWSVIQNVTGGNQKWTFYYNNDVEEGASTTKLIDYVELDKTVKDEAFLAFDFDLNVFMESVQVVLDDTGKETCNPVVTPWANQSLTENNANTNYNAATGAEHNDGAEIDYITWTAT